MAFRLRGSPDMESNQGKAPLTCESFHQDFRDSGYSIAHLPKLLQ